MLFRSYRKRKALESYRHVLGPRLRATWGRREHYTPEEVVVTAATYHLSERFLCYALAMYCDRESFDRYHHEQGDAACSYVRLWHELSFAVSGSDGRSLAEMRLANERDENAGDVGDALHDLGHSWSEGNADGASTASEGSLDLGSWSSDSAGGYDGGGFDGGGGGGGSD